MVRICVMHKRCLIYGIDGGGLSAAVLVYLLVVESRLRKPIDFL
jgi:hypothetical protein